MRCRTAGSLLLALLLGSVPASLATATAGTPVPKLSSRQRAEKIAELSAEERAWMIVYVAPIVLAEERDLFLQLSTDYQREMFRKEFWARRERDGLAPPLGPGYQTRYAHLREVAAQEYDGVDSDAGRMVVRMGEPAGVEDLPRCSEVFRQAEIWTYPNGSSRSDGRHLFYRPSFGAPRRLWVPGDREIFQTSSCLSTFDQACAITSSGSPSKSRDSACPGSSVPKSCGGACSVAALTAQIALRGSDEASVLSRSPAVSSEGLEGLWLRLASVSDPTAKPIAIEGRAARPFSAPEERAEPPEAWSNEKIRDFILTLPKKYREWLDLAGPLLSREDLVSFLRLPPAERDAYVRRFWKQHAHVR
ncbi:MAG: GWxTD domain-containing protein [Acidobacteriota bacterium]